MIYFSKKCKDINVYKPHYEKAKEFSSETYWDPTAFGIHRIWGTHNINDIKKDFPEVEELFKLQDIK